MTVTTNTSRVAYPGKGTKGPFNVPFKIFSPEDLLLDIRAADGTVSTLVLTDDYVVTEMGDGTGRVRLQSPLPDGDTLVIRRVLHITQDAQIDAAAGQNGGLEEQLDRLTMVDQQQQDQLDRSLRISGAMHPIEHQLEITDLTAGKVLTGTGTGFTMSALDSSAVALPGENRTVATLSGYLANNTVFNVKDYGAVGDGVANDAAAINAAVQAAKSAGGGVIYFPMPAVRYYTGTNTILVNGQGLILQAPSANVVIRYAGRGNAISYDLGVYTGHLNSAGAFNLSVQTSHPEANGFYMRCPQQCFFDHCYSESVATTSPSGSAFLIDGTTVTAEHVVLYHCRANRFKIGFRFKGGGVSGQDITVCSTVLECFANARAGDDGTVGVQFEGSNQCSVVGGNFENLSYGVRCVSAPNAVAGITLERVRFEAIAQNNWVIPAASTDCCLIANHYNVNNGSDAAADTVTIDGYGTPRLPSLRWNKKAVTISGGANHTVSRGNASYLEITGPKGPFAVGGFSGGSPTADGTVLEIFNATLQQMTILDGDRQAAPNCSIRTLTGAPVVLAAGNGSAARLIYSGAYSQWVLLSHNP